MTKPYHRQEVVRNRTRSTTATVDDVVCVVAEHFGLTREEMMGKKNRCRRHSGPRQLAMYLTYMHTDYSMAQIGRAMRRDHATIKHGVDKVDDLLDYDMHKR